MKKAASTWASLALSTLAASQTILLTFDNAPVRTSLPLDVIVEVTGGEEAGVILMADNTRVTAVPEPAAILVLGSGIAAARLRRWPIRTDKLSPIRPTQ